MKKLLALAAAPLFGLSAIAAPPLHKEPNNYHDLKEDAHTHFEENAPEGCKDMVPHFAIFGKKDKFYLGIGGTVKVTAGVDLGDPLDDPNQFVTSALTPAAPGNHTKFNLSAMQSSLYVNFVGLPNTDNQIGAFFGMNLLNDYVPVVQYAYVKWRGVKAGYDYSIFSDNGAMPPTIDYEGPCSGTAMPVGTISYTHHFGSRKEWSVGAGIELSHLSLTATERAHGVTQGAPDIPVAVCYAWGQDDWIRASAVLRNMCYRYQPQSRNIDIVGWGVSISGTSGLFGSPLRAYWNATYGRGIASYIQDTAGLGLDLVPTDAAGMLKPTHTWGVMAALQYDITDKVYCSASFSQVRNYADSWNHSTPGLFDGNECTWGETYKYAQYVSGSLFWDINTITTAGVEYIYGRRKNNDLTQAHTNRLQAMIQVRF